MCDNELEKRLTTLLMAAAAPPASVHDYVDTALFGALPCNCAAAPWPIANSIGAQTYAEALQADPDLVKTSSSVGRTWCSLLNWPADPDRRGLLDLRVQQHRRHDRRGAGHGDRRGDRLDC